MMVEVSPLVSIGMPVYNGQKTVRQALNSLLAQDYEHFELIISDNASTDDTQAICLEFAARDRRVRYYRNEVNHGAVWNFNRVFELSSGKYFAWAGSDDRWANAFISKCVAELEKKPSIVLCYPLSQFVDRDGRNLMIVDSDVTTRRLNRLERLHTVILGMYSAVALYGVIRVDMLRRTTLNQYCIHPDKSLLYQLSILGQIVRVSEVLHYYQYVEKSVEQYADQVSLKGDPLQVQNAPILSLPVAILKGIAHLDIHPLHKPYLVVDALYCLRRRYKDRFERERRILKEVDAKKNKIASS
jgi:glycosyltransferase involved in cell wall biosynthesis